MAIAHMTLIRPGQLFNTVCSVEEQPILILLYPLDRQGITG
jgi:hypothetical protein